MKIIDPLAIPESDLPLVMFTDDMLSYISLRIKGHSKGLYSHIGLVVHKDKFASQLFTTFREVDIRDYMKRHYRIKFYKIIGTAKQKRRIIRIVEQQLAKSVFARLYDYLGVIGVRIGMRWLQIPFLNYCSEFVIKALKVLYKFKPRRTPAEMNKRMEILPKKFKYYGHYIVD